MTVNRQNARRLKPILNANNEYQKNLRNNANKALRALKNARVEKTHTVTENRHGGGGGYITVNVQKRINGYKRLPANNINRWKSISNRLANTNLKSRLRSELNKYNYYARHFLNRN